MGRAWQFFLTVAMTITVLAYLYYSSDFYAKRSAESLQPKVSAPAGTAKTGAAE
jgi:hypothetical protein